MFFKKQIYSWLVAVVQKWWNVPAGNLPSVVIINHCCYMAYVCLRKQKKRLWSPSSGVCQHMSRNKMGKWKMSMMILILHIVLPTECFPPAAVIVLATDAVYYCRVECEFTVAAFQVHRLCKDPSERSGQRPSEVVAIQECASDEREAAGCWGDNNGLRFI